MKGELVIAVMLLIGVIYISEIRRKNSTKIEHVPVKEGIKEIFK